MKKITNAVNERIKNLINDIDNINTNGLSKEEVTKLKLLKIYYKSSLMSICAFSDSITNSEATDSADIELENDPIDIDTGGDIVLDEDPIDIDTGGDIILDEDPIDIDTGGDIILDEDPISIDTGNDIVLDADPININIED